MELYYLNDMLLAARRNLEMARAKPEIFGRYAVNYAWKGLKMEEELEATLPSWPSTQRQSLIRELRAHKLEFLQILTEAEHLGISTNPEISV